MVIAEPRLETADERLVGEQRVEIGGRLGDANALDLGRDTAVKIGQRFTVIQPFGLGHEALDEMQDASGPVDEAREQFPGINPGLGPSLIEPGLGAHGYLVGRLPEPGPRNEALAMLAVPPKLLTALDI